MLQHGRVSRDADQELKFGVGSSTPQEDDEDREYHGAHGVDPPFQLAAADTGQDTEAVDEQVVSMVLPQDADLTVLVAQRPAVQEQAEFCGKGYCDCNHGRKVKVVCLGPVVFGDSAHGFDDDDDGDGDHEGAET